MPPEAHAPGSPADWLRHAYSDLALASITPPPQILLEQLCFHAQQAAEKALKAILVAYAISVPRTHNLKSLFDLLPPDLPVPSDSQEAAGLTDYAVASRYPGATEPVMGLSSRWQRAWADGPANTVVSFLCLFRCRRSTHPGSSRCPKSRPTRTTSSTWRSSGGAIPRRVTPNANPKVAEKPRSNSKSDRRNGHSGSAMPREATFSS